MESARFFRLAERVAAYHGVMRARVLKQEEEGPRRSRTPAEQRKNLRQTGGDVVAVPSSQKSYLAERLKEARP